MVYIKNVPIELLTIFNLTKPILCCIFAMKQNIRIMKTKKILNVLAFSVLCLFQGAAVWAQKSLVQLLGAETVSAAPVLSCFFPSYAYVGIRNDFGMKELMLGEAGISFAAGKNRIFVSVNHYGYAEYGELQAAAGYGRSFGDRFAMSARIFYLMAHARRYPLRHSLSADFSVACKISSKLILDVDVFNPFMMRYGITGQEVIPLIFGMGCAYQPVRQFLVSFRMSKTLPGPLDVGVRFLCQPVVPLVFGTDCTNSHLGGYVGWKHKGFLLSVQAAWYYRVSVSPRIGVGYFWKEG